MAKRLRDLVGDERHVQVEFLVHLDAFDASGGYLDAGYCSLWDFCLRALHLREGAAGRRIAAMRVLRRFPSLEAPLRDGRLCLSTAALLAPVLTAENLDDVVARAAYCTKAEVDHLVASLQPRTAPKEGIRKLPEPRTIPPEPRAVQPERSLSAPAAPESEAPPASLEPPTGASASRAASADTVEETLAVTALPALPPRHDPPRAGEVRPISATAWSLRVTIDGACKADIEALVALLSHKTGSDLAAVLHEAVRCAIDKHGKRRGAVAPARAGAKRADPVTASTERQLEADSRPAPRSRYIPAAVRRDVWKRDGGCCAWVGPDGRRCGSRWKVQIDHLEPFALGGTCEDPGKLRIACARHNAHYADQVYGREHMSRFRRQAAGGERKPTPAVRGLFVREPGSAWGIAGAA